VVPGLDFNKLGSMKELPVDQESSGRDRPMSTTN